LSKIGEAIRAARQARGVTARHLAREIHLSEQFISDVERGYRVPSFETTLVFCNAFPDQDSAAWLWLTLRDQHGDPIADVMTAYAKAAG
jgi:transcriptional regulator with XRE-family HTH domain